MTRLLTAAIHLVLLMAVTFSVIAETASQPLTKNLNLPPESIDFDLSDLIDAEQKQRDQKQKDEWAAYQVKIAAAYTETRRSPNQVLTPQQEFSAGRDSSETT